MDQPIAQPQKDSRGNSLSADYTTSRSGFESSRQAEARQTEARQSEATREATESRQAEARTQEAARDAAPSDAARTQEANRENANIEHTNEGSNVAEGSPVMISGENSAGVAATEVDTSVQYDPTAINDAINLSVGDDDYDVPVGIDDVD